MALIWVTVSMVVLIGIVGLALDTGYAVLVGGQLQSAADAAALAGARIVAVAPTGAKTVASNVGGMNTAARAPVRIDPNVDVVVGTFDQGTQRLTAGTANPNAVRVTARRTSAVSSGPVPLFFGAMFGVPTLDMARSATAVVSVSYNPALIVLDPTGSCSLDVGGGGVVAAAGNSIQVNSSDPAAACFSGSSASSAAYLNVTGGVSGGSRFTGTTFTGVPPLPDPLASLPAPPRGPRLGRQSIATHTTVTLDPGYYDGGIDVQGTLNLKPGIYIIGGTGLSANAHAVISGTGVMLYITDGAGVGLQSTGMDMVLTPPDPTRDTFPGADIYQGVSIFQDRADRTAATLPLSGSFDISGTIYLPSAQLRITAGGSQTGLRLIVFDLQMRGNSALNLVAPDGLSNTGRPYLVE
jgi:Flp pilus assembly protein TadG